MPGKIQTLYVPLYKQQCNLVSNKIKQAKMQYYNDKFNNNIHDAKSILESY